MRTFFRHHSPARLGALAVIGLALVALLAFDLIGPVTSLEQQAIIGAILVLGIPAIWLL